MYLILLAAGLIVFGGAAALLPAPGYMDAEYYFATAGQLAQGKGFVEPFLWNYLSAPGALPAPSHTYWQPLASLVAAAPMAFLGRSFRIAQTASVLFASLIPLLSARLAISLEAGRRAAWFAGGLAFLPGFFAPYLLTTDTFGLFAVIGGVLLWQVAEVVARPMSWRWFALGALVALANLARADGLLLWVPALVALFAVERRRLRHFGLLLAGFGLLMAPWWLRNLGATGALLSPGATRALWLLDYDELFFYPASRLTFARWWGAGLSTLLVARLQAAWTILQSAVAVNGYIMLLPLMVVGGFARRRHPSVRAGALYAAALSLFLSLIFPFAGARGGFFHSSAALMPLLYALAAAGLEQAAIWIAPRLHWDAGRTRVLLGTVALLLAGALSLWALAGKAGAFGAGASFGRNQMTYNAAEELLRSQDETISVVAVGNPPGFYLATGRAAVAIPHGAEHDLKQVASAYGVDWVLLEADHPRPLDDLYLAPSARDWLAAPLTFLDPAGRPVYLYRVVLEGGP
jgi:hypothetical protein